MIKPKYVAPQGGPGTPNNNPKSNWGTIFLAVMIAIAVGSIIYSLI